MGARPGAPDGRVTIGRVGDVTTLNPVLYGDLRTGEVVNRIFDHLVLTDAHGGFVPGRLCAGWDVQPDGLRWDFRLRDDARWHDGTPVTAEDACFTLAAMLDPSVGSPRRAEFLVDGEPIAFTAVGAKRLRITLPAPFPPLLASLAWRPLIPRHLFEGGRLADSPYNGRPVGSGPFRFDGWTPGERVSMRAHTGYHLGAPPLAAVDWRCYPTAAAAVDAFTAGEVDYVAGVPPDRVSALEEDGAHVVRTLEGSFTYLGFRVDREPFRDVRVRRAVAAAIDADRLVADVLHGEGRVATSPVAPVSPWHNPAVVRAPFDPRQAGELLDAAGWVPDRTGRRSLALTIHTVASDALKERAAAAIASDLGAVGIDVRLERREMGELLRRHAVPGHFQALLLGLTPGLDPSFLHAVYHSAMRPPTGWNVMRLADPELDRLLDASQRATDPGERARVVGEVQARVAQVVPHVLLFHPTTVDAADPALEIPAVPPGAGNPFMHLHQWRWTP